MLDCHYNDQYSTFNQKLRFFASFPYYDCAINSEKDRRGDGAEMNSHLKAPRDTMQVMHGAVLVGLLLTITATPSRSYCALQDDRTPYDC